MKSLNDNHEILIKKWADPGFLRLATACPSPSPAASPASVSVAPPRHGAAAANVAGASGEKGQHVD